MSDPDDAELLRRHVAGDDEAFGVLVRLHRDRLWAVALRTLGNPEDAADAVQDALINAFRRASSFRGDASVTTWLHRIVVNACLDRIRLAASRPSVAWNDDLEPPSSGPDPGNRAATRLDVDVAPGDDVVASEQQIADLFAESGQIASPAPDFVKWVDRRYNETLRPLLLTDN